MRENKNSARGVDVGTRFFKRFHSAVGYIVLICFVGTCRHDLLVGAR